MLLPEVFASFMRAISSHQIFKLRPKICLKTKLGSSHAPHISPLLILILIR